MFDVCSMYVNSKGTNLIFDQSILLLITQQIDLIDSDDPFFLRRIFSITSKFKKCQKFFAFFVYFSSGDQIVPRSSIRQSWTGTPLLRKCPGALFSYSEAVSLWPMVARYVYNVILVVLPDRTHQYVPIDIGALIQIT